MHFAGLYVKLREYDLRYIPAKDESQREENHGGDCIRVDNEDIVAQSS